MWYAALLLICREKWNWWIVANGKTFFVEFPNRKKREKGEKMNGKWERLKVYKNVKYTDKVYPLTSFQNMMMMMIEMEFIGCKK